MNIDIFIRRLSVSRQVIEKLLLGVGTEQARWKPQPEKWSILEVVNHLADEERDDFRKRIDLTLHHPQQEWTPVDPPAWAIERRYNERDLGSSSTDFFSQRDHSLQWLNTLRQADWSQSRQHPKIGSISAGDLLAAWAAHDLLHIRQITNLHLGYWEKQAEPYSIRYASP